ncbi:MAG: hypothetical protein WCV99_16410 [Sterolibacterium sp.]|jgi:hypothetical protein
MEGDGVVKMLYSEKQVAGRKIWVFECGVPQQNSYGDADISAFANDFSPNRNVYYEANDMEVKWFRSPFFTTKTPPSDDELRFQLEKWHRGRQVKFIVAGFICAFIIYKMFA